LLASYDVPGQITAVEDLIAQGADMQLVIRLLCLASITAGGIKSKTLENIKKEVLQVGFFEQRDNDAPDDATGLRI
jgi:vacuolar protein sorting-associated protein 33A